MFKYASMITTDNADNEITFTNAQYLKQCDVIADGTADELARDLWEKVKAEVCEHWDKVCDLSNYDCDMARRQQRAKVNNMRKRLDAYRVAFEVMDCELLITEYEPYSEFYPKKVIYSVKLVRDNHSLGFIQLH